MASESSLLASEIHADDVRTVIGLFGSLGFWDVVLRLFVLFVGKLCGVRLKRERELDGRVVELGYRVEGHVESRRDASERQADGEIVLLNLQIPEAVLDDDGHLVREALEQMLWNGHSRHAGLEGHVDMVLAVEDH